MLKLRAGVVEVVVVASEGTRAVRIGRPVLRGLGMRARRRAVEKFLAVDMVVVDGEERARESVKVL